MDFSQKVAAWMLQMCKIRLWRIPTSP